MPSTRRGRRCVTRMAYYTREEIALIGSTSENLALMCPKRRDISWGDCDRARPDHHTASALNLHPLEARASPFSPWHACASNVGWPAQWLPPAEYRIDPTARLDAPGLGTHPPVVVRLGWTSLLHARLRGHEPSVRGRRD